ncbi:MAG: hypothetical protein VW405_16660 [Rhodospirillaceae bacterium]
MPFTGMNSAIAGGMIPPGQATTCTNCDFADGTLRGMYGGGTTVTTLAASKQHLHYEHNLGWVAQTEDSWHLYDSKASSGYYSFFNDGSTVYYSNATRQKQAMGLAAPGSAPTAGSGTPTTPARYFRYTYTTQRVPSTYAPMESNPSSAARLTTATVNVTASGSAQVDGIKLYASTGDTDGPYYLVGTFANTTTAVTPSDPTSTTASRLDFELNGRKTQAYYDFDHSPAPGVNTIGSAFHAAVATGTSVAPCSGILFYGVNNYLMWSQAGYPWYVPALNAFNAGGYIEGIVTSQAITYVLTRREIYVVTGYDDQDLTIQRSDSPFGTTYGQSACMTPYGLVFQAETGLALFDGNTSRIITADVLAPTELYGQQLASVWRDGQLLMVSQNDGNGGYVIDFSRGPDALVVTKHNLDTRAITQALAHPSATHDEGTYICTWTDGYVKKWHPRQRGNVSGASAQAWTWVSGRLGGEAPNALKYFRQIRVEASGTISLDVKCYNNAATQVGSTCTVTGDSWLPGNFVGDYLTITATSSDGSGVLYGITVEAEVAQL